MNNLRISYELFSFQLWLWCNFGTFLIKRYVFRNKDLNRFFHGLAYLDSFYS